MILKWNSYGQVAKIYTGLVWLKMGWPTDFTKYIGGLFSLQKVRRISCRVIIRKDAHHEVRQRRMSMGRSPFPGLQENLFYGSGPHLLAAASKLGTNTWNRKCSEYFNTTKEGHENLTCGSKRRANMSGPVLPASCLQLDTSRCYYQLLQVRSVVIMRQAVKSERGALSDQKKVVFRELLNYQNTKVPNIG